MSWGRRHCARSSGDWAGDDDARGLYVDGGVQLHLASGTTSAHGLTLSRRPLTASLCHDVRPRPRSVTTSAHGLALSRRPLTGSLCRDVRSRPRSVTTPRILITSPGQIAMNNQQNLIDVGGGGGSDGDVFLQPM